MSAFSHAEYRREVRAPLYASRPDVLCHCGCGRILPKKPLGKKWFSGACRSRARHATARVRDHLPKEQRHPKAKYIYEAVKDTEPGLCPWCDEPLPKGRKTSCGDKECGRAYQRAYRAGRTEAARGELQERTCECGCGLRFMPDAISRKYIDARHAQDAANAQQVARNAKKRAARKATAVEGQRKHGPGITFGKATESKVIRPFSRTE